MGKTRCSEITFQFSNFAGIQTSPIRVAPLTVIAGPNSAGKTYVVYAIYSFLRNLRFYLSVQVPPNVVAKLAAQGSAEIDVARFASVDVSERVSAQFKSGLGYFFSVKDDFFADASVKVNLPRPDVKSEGWATQVLVRKDLVLDISKAPGSTVCTLTLLRSEDAPFTEPVGRSGPTPNSAIRRAVVTVLTDLVYEDLLVRPFPITSERTGISLFWKELDISKNQLIEKIVASRGKKIDPWDLIEEETSRYALPITDNIDVARDAENVAKGRSFIAQDPALQTYIRSVFDQIAGGRYKYTQEGISFEYLTGRKRSTIPIYVASSSSKSLFLLDLYLNNVAAPGDLLVFDEPELNLHLSNQRLMAQLLARLVSIGVNVLITTHSDFLIRELNNRVMLSNEFAGKESLFQEGGIDPKEVLRKDQVCGYLLKKNRKLEPVPVSEFGLEMDSIESAISGASNLQGNIISLMTAGE